MATPPSCAPGNVHILGSHNRPSLETDLVLCDVSSWAWTCFPWVNWMLKGDTKVKEEGVLSRKSFFPNLNTVYILDDAF